MPRSCKVAVIGASVSGLVAARELVAEGHDVTVFEKSGRVGGTWVYDPEADSDPLGLNPTRKVVHGSLYRSLRTNLPRPIMGFTDYPFPGPTEGSGDPRFFPGHEEVLGFLEGFASRTGVAELVRFGAEVVRVRMGRRKDEWAVEFRREGEELEAEVFEAVVVCNGHHTEPKLAEIPGISKWPGKQIHSHNYRIPEPFQNQILVIVGKGPSAHDISRELSVLAKEVHLASRSPDIETGKLDGYSNIWQHSAAMIFAAIELQSKWVARVLSEKVTLPAEEDMLASVGEYYLQMEEMGRPKHYTHVLHPNEIDYLNWLAAEAGSPPLEEWRNQLYRTVIKFIASNDNDQYRDTLDADYWMQQWQSANLRRDVLPKQN